MASNPSKSEPSGSGKRKALLSDSPRFFDSPSHLLYRAHQMVADNFATGANPLALTMRQFVLLSAIAVNGGASQSELVRKTGIDRSTLAEMIARLQSRGLVDRGRVHKDGRAKSVRITPEGKKAIEEARPRAERADKALLASLSKRRRAHLLEILRAITDLADEKKKAKAKKPKGGDSDAGEAAPEVEKPGPGRKQAAVPALAREAARPGKASKKSRKSERQKARKSARGADGAVHPVARPAALPDIGPGASPVVKVVAKLESALSRETALSAPPSDQKKKRGSAAVSGTSGAKAPKAKGEARPPERAADGPKKPKAVKGSGQRKRP